MSAPPLPTESLSACPVCDSSDLHTVESMSQVLARAGQHPLLLEANPQHLLLTDICTNRQPAPGLRQRLRRWLCLP